MPNWCYNSVTFNGDENAIGAAMQFFKAARENQQQEKGWLPDFIQNKNSYMFDLAVDEASIQYRTKWVPNLGVMEQIADHFGIGFTDKFHELGMELFGEASLQNGVASEFYLDEEDFHSFEFDEKNNMFIYKAQGYESQWDILELLLEDKKSANRGLSR